MVKLFWRSVTDLWGKSKRTSNIIDDFSNDNDVSECFAHSYENVFNQVGFNCSDINELYNDVTVDISSNCICESECHTHVISSINIHSAIKKLKSGKNDGFDGLTSDYILNASPVLYEYLSFLFTCMLHHSFSPSTFCISTMIPIPKRFNKDLSKSQNYRGIALSSLFSKIFDHCIISCEDAALKSDDLQFAYKSGMSTIQCASVVTETINYYLHNKSDYICVQLMHQKLLIVLIYLYYLTCCENVIFVLCTFLMYSYCNQRMRVRWNSSNSREFLL